MKNKKIKILFGIIVILVIVIGLVVFSKTQNQEEKTVKLSDISQPEKHIPTGFYYKEGTLEDGYVITDGTNEFVWIPVTTTTDYKKEAGQHNWYVTESGGSSEIVEEMVKGDKLGNIPEGKILGQEVITDLTNQPEAEIVKKAGGFWVGRFEVGIENTEHENIAGVNGISFKGSNEDELDAYWEERKNEIVIKQGVEPVRNITQTKALEIANNWKSGNSNKNEGTVAFQSGLITGTAWDTMCKFIGWDECNNDCTNWGNYANIASAKYKGYHSSDCASDWKNETTESVKGTDNNRWIFPTGKFVNDNDKTTAKKNIYDVAGNVWEWTTEIAQYGPEDYVLRGGGAYHAGDYGALATSRSGGSPSMITSDWDWGFRIMLYVE